MSFVNAMQRRLEIFEILQTNGSAEVSELSERFNVTSMTIRRDLALFESQGLIITNYGGATLKQVAGVEPSFALKQSQMQDAKQRIAQKAADYIKDWDSIILDCGTTALEMLKYIGKKKITVITHSWPAINYLHGNSRVNLYLAPGKYDEVSAGVLSPMTIDFYKNYHADLVFLGTQGFDPEYGATVSDITESNLKEALLQSGKKRILLVDSSKIGKKFLSRHATCEQFDTIITDDALPPAVAQSLQACCKSVDLV